MKKFFSLTLIFCMLLCSMSVFAAAEQIVINGEVVTIPEDMGVIREIDDRTFVPLRFVSESFGCTVNYQETTYNNDGKIRLQSTATITDPSKSLSFFVTVGDDKLYTISSTVHITQMDTKVFVSEDDDRMYIPIRFLAEALGYTVSWDEATQTVSLDMAQ